MMNRPLLTIAITFTAHICYAQAQIITGSVKDSVSGLPVQSCSILMENTRKGTLTDKSGNFKITVVSGHTNNKLIFQSIGYQTDTIAIHPGQKN